MRALSADGPRSVHAELAGSDAALAWCCVEHVARRAAAGCGVRGGDRSCPSRAAKAVMFARMRGASAPRVDDTKERILNVGHSVQAPRTSYGRPYVPASLSPS